MKKTPSLFLREDVAKGKQSLVLPQVTPGCEWVINGEGTATVKFDGTAVLIRDGKAFKRFDGKWNRTPPDGFEPCCPPDQLTGHWPGWVPVSERNSADAWICVAVAKHGPHYDGTYEACGPMINGNNEQLDEHVLWRHGSELCSDAPRDFAGLKAYLADGSMEGIVWHHPDGRLCKIKTRDFGWSWPKCTA